MLARPLCCLGVVPSPVRFVDVRNLRHERIVGVRVRQERADREQHLADRQRRRPLILEDIEANTTTRVDVRVINPRRERDLERRRASVCGGSGGEQALARRTCHGRRERRARAAWRKQETTTHLRRLKGVVEREMYVDEEDATFVR